MTDYLLLYSGGKMPETEADQADVMKAWDGWMTSIGPALKDGGNPFTPQAKTIDPMGKVTDGPAGSPASGYSIIQASSLDDAVKRRLGPEMPSSKPAASQPAMSNQARPRSRRLTSASSRSEMKRLSHGHRNSSTFSPSRSRSPPRCFTWPE